jgi:hypothetical protein
MVSTEEMRKAESEVAVAVAQADIARAQIRESELRLDQLKRMQNHPDRLEEFLARVDRSESSASVERRLSEVERKLDQLIEAVNRLKGGNPDGSTRSPKQ